MSKIAKRQIEPDSIDSSLVEDGTLMDADIAGDAGIQLSKLSISGATANSIIGFDGEAWVPIDAPEGVLGGAQVPTMNGVGATGTSGSWSREDHVHPSDTSRAPLSSPAFTGIPTAPTASINTNTTQIATTAFAVSQDAIIPTLTADPTGFPNRTATTLSFDSGTRTFTISPAGLDFDVWLFGTKYTKTAENVVISNTSGLHYISYETGGVLAESMVFFDLASCAQVATILWDAVGGVGILYDERHGLSMDWATHKHLHLTQGTGIVSGFSLSGYTLNTDTDAAVTWATTAGVLVDEDIYHSIAEQGESNYLVMYRSGEGGVWRWVTKNVPYHYGTYAQYNLDVGGTWSLADASSGNFVNCYILGTPAGIVVLPGQSQYTTLAAAQAASVLNYVWGVMPFAEVTPLYKVTMEVKSVYTNTGKCRIASIDRLVGSRISVSSVVSPSNHASLTGLLGANVHPASSIGNTPAGNIAATDVQGALDELDTEKAPLASPTFTGTPAAPTATVDTNTTQIATTAFVVGQAGATGPLRFRAGILPISMGR